jgi:hypothetical protein
MKKGFNLWRYGPSKRRSSRENCQFFLQGVKEQQTGAIFLWPLPKGDDFFQDFS